MKQNTTVHRPLCIVADDIRRNWKSVWYGAVPYLEAMQTMNSHEEDYGMDSGTDIVARFLCNATTWKGEDARRIKLELKAMLKR